jgi:hypothetical protein
VDISKLDGLRRADLIRGKKIKHFHFITERIMAQIGIYVKDEFKKQFKVELDAIIDVVLQLVAKEGLGEVWNGKR